MAYVITRHFAAVGWGLHRHELEVVDEKVAGHSNMCLQFAQLLERLQGSYT
jgi:hypothetical protein